MAHPKYPWKMSIHSPDAQSVNSPTELPCWSIGYLQLCKKINHQNQDITRQDEIAVSRQDNFSENVESVISSVVDGSFLTNPTEVNKEIAKAVFNVSFGAQSKSVAPSRNGIGKEMCPCWKVVRGIALWAICFWS